jgi:hypothetical protein
MNIRVPGVDSAIKHLRPKATFSIYNRNILDWNCPDGTQPPSWEEVEQQIIKDVETYNYYAYSRDRKKEYGSWEEQLNMIFDDLKSGNLETGSWVSMVESIKEKYPKPQ